MRQPATYQNETQTVRRVAAHGNCRWIWTRHFFEEAAEEDPQITQPDVEHALREGRVTLVEHKQDILWRVVGRDLDLRSIVAVVAVFEDELKIKVVTVWVGTQ